MTDDNSTNNLVDMDNLDNFEKELFNPGSKSTAEVEDKKDEVEEVDENEDDSLATSEGTDAPEGDEGSEEDKSGEEEAKEESDEDASEEDKEPEEKPRKNRKPAKERINELYATTKHQERQIADLVARLDERDRKPNEAANSESPKPDLKETLPEDAPKPDAQNAEGKPLYPLGEFDPNYILALNKFIVNREFKVREDQATREAQNRQLAQAREALQAEWAEKVHKVEESEIPDIREDINDLVDSFSGLEPTYGEYLAATIMSCENGPQIMHYLSQNIGEAQKIVASGASAATLAIGKLDSKLSKAEAEEKRNKRVSSAAKPPVQANKGRSAASTTRGDTDDLDAFEKVLFAK